MIEFKIVRDDLKMLTQKSSQFFRLNSIREQVFKSKFTLGWQNDVLGKVLLRTSSQREIYSTIFSEDFLKLIVSEYQEVDIHGSLKNLAVTQFQSLLVQSESNFQKNL